MYEPLIKPAGVGEWDGYVADIKTPLTPERKAYLEEQHMKYKQFIKEQEENKNGKKAV